MIYVDSNVAIRWVEGAPTARAPLAARITTCLGVPRSLVTSRLTRLECRVKPLKFADAGTLAQYDIFFLASELVVYDLTPDVIEKATEVRATLGVKTPDAIHLATAILAGASAFLTGDRGLTRCTEIPVEVL